MATGMTAIENETQSNKKEKPGITWLFRQTNKEDKAPYLCLACIFYRLGGFRTIHQLYKCHRRIIALAETHLQNAQIAAVTVCITRAEVCEQFHHDFSVTQARKGQALVRLCIGFSERENRLDDAAQFLGFRQSGFNCLMAQQRNGHVAQHCQTMR